MSDLLPDPRRPPVAEVRLKGVTFRSFVAVLDELRGPDVTARTLAAVPELGAALRYGSLLATSWYPVGWYAGALGAARDVTGEGMALVRSIATGIIDRDMRTVYRVILSGLGPGTIFALGERLHRAYYDGLRMTLLEKRHGYGHARWTECKGFDENLWASLLASVEHVLLLGGAKNVRLRVIDGGRADEHCEAIARWT